MPELYHYTSFNAAMEILRSNTLYLSHTAFSNDPTELSYGLDVMKNVFGEAGLRVFRSYDFLSILRYNTQPYIFCLTESKDMLSQWEMYSGRNGCCITFSSEISKLAIGDRVALAPVIYDKEEQRSYLEYLNDQRQQLKYRKQDQDRLSTNLYFLLSTVFLKDPAWCHEREWRIVKIVQEESFGDIKYRSGSRFLKPYVSINREPLPITEIRIGPADEQDRLLYSMEHLVKMTRGYENVDISSSTIRLSPS